MSTPFLQFIASVTDYLGEVRTIAARIGYLDETDGGTPGDVSELMSAAHAEPEWLEWLGQHVGVNTSLISAEAEKRTRIADAASGWLGGSRYALRAAAQTVLTGTKLVIFNIHFGANVWAIEIQTDTSETPGGGASVLTAVAPAKPAGVILTHSFLSNLTWADWETLSTWTAIEAEGTWDQLQDI